MPAVVAPAVALVLASAPALLVLLLPLLLHAAMASVEVATATTAASVLLIRASFWQGPGNPGRPRVCYGHVNERLLS